MTTQPVSKDIRSTVRQHYGQIAESFRPAQSASCCGPSTQAQSCCAPQTSSVALYEDPEAFKLPEDVTGLSLGCGDPITLAALQPGQTVLDLGSGGGIDCFLAAQKVGSTGRVIGVDMTYAMLEKARANKEKLNAQNVEFRLGEIEHLPVADATVDVVISNCVINLSPDKAQVFREAFRVLRPGGKIAVSDIVTDGPLPAEIKDSLSAWAGCVAGAIDVKDYTDAMRAAGFQEVQISPVYLPKEMVDEAVQQLGESGLNLSADDAMYKTVFSAKIRAVKPAV